MIWIGRNLLRHCSLFGGVVSFSLLMMVGGCGASSQGRTVLPITIDPASLTLPGDGASLTTHDAAIRGIASILVKDLGLPVPEQVTVYVYASRPVFEQGLIQDAHVSPVRAAELSDFAIGIGKRRLMLFNDEAYEVKGREWLRLVAHELSHVSQIELAQGEGRAEQWLAEGMAEWVAFTVLERLGLDTMDHRRALARAGIKSHAALVAARLDLDTLGSPRGFTVRHLREGSLPTYQLAFLMADYVIKRDGFPKIVQYFASFAERQHRLDNFRRAFGQSLAEFEREILGHLKSITR
ncbi:MAG: hypothetical protein HYU51_00540 [Candidatus Rokubacteria bacterium]|nr:hypothetical protein [Candidatus Rokubacteria bacterium]